MAATLKRAEILRLRRDLTRVRRNGARLGTRFLQIRFAPTAEPALPTHLPGRRAAFLLPSGIRPAVARNRLKRRLREAFRLNKTCFPPGFDYLLLPSVSAAGMNYGDIETEVRALAARLPC
jgi:ribonuclease P protein component